MANFFPTDVSFRLDGDRAEATQYMGIARALFFKATLMADRMEGKPVQISQKLGELGYVTVSLLGDAKIINMHLPPRPTTATTTETPTFETKVPPSAGSLHMLTGIVRGPTTVVVDSKNYLRDFCPTQPTAAAYGLNYAYEDNRKLGDNQPFHTKRSSMFSGAMKRIVQATFGMGRITDSSGYYLTPPVAATRNIEMLYACSPYQAHGIYKAGAKNHWLIEVSVTRGVLAMPLPLINTTRTLAYRKHLANIRDTGGLAVVDEFGGLPSGETFPTGTDLTTAITNGKVLRLLTASELAPYYGDTVGETHSFFWSWAFSDSGARADNVRFNYRKIRGDPKYSINGEHWSLRLQLSPYNLNPGVGNPVGTGSATLTMLHTGRMAKSAIGSLWSSDTDEKLGNPLLNFVSLDLMDLPLIGGELLKQYGEDGWGCILYVFFHGEQIERVKYVPPFVHERWVNSQTGIFGTDPDSGGIIYAPARSAGHVISPGGIISDAIDMRALAISDGPYTVASGPLVPELVVGPGSGPGGVYLPGEPTNWVPNPLLSSLLAAMNYSTGVGDYGGRPNCIPVVFGIIPALCREGFINARFKYQLTGVPSEMAAKGYFGNIAGVRGIACEQGWNAPPVRLYPPYFAAVINAGPSEAYVMTRSLRPSPQLVGLPPSSPGYNYVNLLPNTGEKTIDKLHFIGGY